MTTLAPTLGEVRKASEIGKKGNKWVWAACPDCGKERWVMAYATGKPMWERCLSCACKNNQKNPRGLGLSGVRKFGSSNPNWRGGIRSLRGRYETTKLDPDDPFYPMTSKITHRVATHRLIMAKHLGRCLQDFEVVHHKNGNRLDNRLENLNLLTNPQHRKYHTALSNNYTESIPTTIVLQQLEDIRKEIRLLRYEMKQRTQ